MFNKVGANHCPACGKAVRLGSRAMVTHMSNDCPRFALQCSHGHQHRFESSRDRCEDGESGAATGSRLALR